MITPLRSAPLAALLERVREQYREMPGLKLTKPQATLLFGVAPSVCAAMLRALVMEKLSVPQRRGPVCAIDHILANEPDRVRVVLDWLREPSGLTDQRGASSLGVGGTRSWVASRVASLFADPAHATRAQ